MGGVNSVRPRRSLERRAPRTEGSGSETRTNSYASYKPLIPLARNVFPRCWEKLVQPRTPRTEGVLHLFAIIHGPRTGFLSEVATELNHEHC